MKTPIISVCVISIAILCVALAFWATCTDEAREIDNLAKDALCVLELQGGRANASASFTTSQTVDQFYVGARPQANHERLWLSISGSKAPFSYNGPVTQATRFTCGHQIPPGSYTVALRQEAGDKGGLVVIAGEEPPAHVARWRIWPHAILGLLVLSGVGAFIARKSKNLRHRAVSVYAFQMLLLVFVTLFLYLFFHEGGHALGEMFFGRYDFARSDFWGIHGRPHSGGTSGPGLELWQQAVITGGGPMLPTFAGWAFFVLWLSRIGQDLRNNRPTVNLYLSAIVVVLILPSVVLAGCLLGIVNDSETQFFISNVPGPSWLIRSLLWGVLLVNAVILWRVVPELWRIWKTHKQAWHSLLEEHARQNVMVNRQARANRPVRRVLKWLLGRALAVLLVASAWFWLPTTVRYHVSECYSFQAKEADSRVFLGVMLPNTGHYQRVENVTVSWEGDQSREEGPEVDVVKLSGDVRHAETKEAVIAYDVVLWRGRARWEGPVEEWQVQPRKDIESGNAAFVEKVGELADGQSRGDAYRIFKFASSCLSWPKGSRTMTSQSALKAYETGEGGCGEFANLTVALCRAAKIPSKAISGLYLPPYPPFWSSSTTWNHPGGAHAWIEVHTEVGWELADPSLASLIPWKSLWFGRTDGCHLSYGEVGREQQAYNAVKDWAFSRGKILGAMSAPNKFVAAAQASSVSVTPQVMIKMGCSDWRWFALLGLIFLSIAWRIRQRHCRRRAAEAKGRSFH
ncbi:MAG: transglutaminase domain-containing protein [Thermoguttaceae bacterium]